MYANHARGQDSRWDSAGIDAISSPFPSPHASSPRVQSPPRDSAPAQHQSIWSPAAAPTLCNLHLTRILLARLLVAAGLCGISGVQRPFHRISRTCTPDLDIDAPAALQAISHQSLLQQLTSNCEVPVPSVSGWRRRMLSSESAQFPRRPRPR